MSIPSRLKSDVALTMQKVSNFYKPEHETHIYKTHLRRLRFVFTVKIFLNNDLAKICSLTPEIQKLGGIFLCIPICCAHMTEWRTARSTFFFSSNL